jgi:phage anti-repressor protein
VRFEHLLSAEWRKPVQVYANDSDHDDVGGYGNRSSRADTAPPENESLDIANGREIDSTDGLWRQSSAWIEQIGSDKLPRVSKSQRSRQTTERNLDDNSTGWGTTPGTLRSIFIADSLDGNNTTDAPGSDEGAGSTEPNNVSQWHSVSAAAMLKAAGLDVITRLRRPDVTDQVVAEMDAALSASKHDVDYPLTALFADESADSSGTDEAILFASYVHGSRVVAQEAAARVPVGREDSIDRHAQSGRIIQGSGSLRQNRANSASSSVGNRIDSAGDHDQLYLEMYAQGGWLAGDHGQHYKSSPDCDLPVEQALTLEERENREHERWRVDRTLSQQTRRRARHSIMGGSEQQEEEPAVSDYAETKSRWVIPSAEIGPPMPGGTFPSVIGYGSGADTTNATSKALPETASYGAAIEAAWAPKHRMTRLRKERQHELRQQQMQYSVDRDKKQAVAAQTDYELTLEGAHQPATFSKHDARRACNATHADAAGEISNEDEEGNDSTVAADFFAGYLHASLSDSLSGPSA